MQRVIRIVLASLIISVLLFSVSPSGVALADQADPDSTPAPVVTNVYRNLLETGDNLYLVYANIPYSSIPDTPVTDAFLVQLVNTSTDAVIGTTLGTAFNDSGYGYNVYALYFSAADAPTWAQNYTIRLAGNPTVFDVPPTYDYLLGLNAFSALTEQEDVQNELALRVLVIAGDLRLRWGLTSSTELTKSLEAGTVLSLPGESFFRPAIFGLQAMAPGAFEIGQKSITAEDRVWVTEYAANVSTQYVGTFVGTAQQAGQNFFNKGYDLVSVIFIIVVCVAIVIAHVTAIKSTMWSGMIDVALVLVIMARLGIPAILITFMGLMGAMCWIYISAKIWGVVR